ncbi:MAG: beta galactosidase jelly roll domain-containing protein [Bacteroidota bacterium]
MKNLLHLLIFPCLLLLNSSMLAADWELVLDLKGSWAFTIGDNMDWAAPEFDDSDWESMAVPGQWEKNGFEGYDGYGWYRLKFSAKQISIKKDLYLHLGEIDDADEVYLNGVLIGSSGSFPPYFATAYNSKREYLIPRNLLRKDKPNFLAVRVYDEYYEGGILKGNIGLYKKSGAYSEFMSLEGLWDFKPTADGQPCLGEDKAGWDNIMVPAQWEHQGYDDYDGFACYRKVFVCPDYVAKRSHVITLGLIDDLDEVYINGVRVGSTGFDEWGKIPDRENGWAWKVLRGYVIPDNVLKAGQKNVITVKVFDKWGGGGIYEGPVGLIPTDMFTSFVKNIALE